MRIVLTLAAVVVAVVLGVSLSLWVFGPPSGQQNAQSGALPSSGVASIGGAFQLTDHTGKQVDDSILMGKPSLVYFGFTFCPDFCPTELSNMAAAADLASEEGLEIGLVFISIDPERDTPEVMAEYVEAFHERMIGLTGDAEQVAAAAKAYKVIYRKNRNPDSPDGYAMDHTTFLYGMDAQGQFLKHFTANTDPREIVDTLKGQS